MPPPAIVMLAEPATAGLKLCTPMVLNDNTLEPRFSVVKFANTRLFKMATLPIKVRSLPIVTPSRAPKFEISGRPPLLINVPPKIVPPASSVIPITALPMSKVVPVLSSNPLTNRFPPVWVKVAIPARVNCPPRFSEPADALTLTPPALFQAFSIVCGARFKVPPVALIVLPTPLEKVTGETVNVPNDPISVPLLISELPARFSVPMVLASTMPLLIRMLPSPFIDEPT